MLLQVDDERIPLARKDENLDTDQSGEIMELVDNLEGTKWSRTKASAPTPGEIRQYWRTEDETYAKLPKYEDIVQEVREEALDLAGQRNVDMRDLAAVIALAREELAIFWKLGGLTSPDAYRHGFVARALVEKAMEESGVSYDALDMLKETVTSLNMTWFADGKPNQYAIDLLWAVLEQQNSIIESGEHGADASSYYTMCDRILLARRKTGNVEARESMYRWLLDHAEEGGWTCRRRYIEKGVELTKKGIDYIMPSYVYKRPVELQDIAVVGRRLRSFQGTSPLVWESKTYLWEDHEG